MNKHGSRSQAKLIRPSVDHKAHPSSSDHLPMLSAKQLTPSRPPLLSHRKQQPLLSTPMIEKSKKNLLLMRKINPLNRPHSRSSSSESSRIMKRLDSGKEVKHLPELMILKPNLDKRTYLRQPLVRQSLVGEEAIQKFYQRYKQIDKRKEKQAFMNQKHALTNIIALLQMHNFTPRKLTVVKLKGEDAILDLKKLGLGQGSMGPVVTQIVNYLQRFEQVDLSYNRIDSLLGQSLIQKLGKVKKIDLSHNRIGKMGCQKIAEMFLVSGTRIQQLNLEQNNLLDNAGVILLEHVLRFNNLKKLNVNKNFMGTKFASKLKQVLVSDRQLHELYLSWNEFNSKAVRSILEGVAEHTDLKVFDFSWNKIQSQNVEVLARIFSEAQNLIHADFSFCELGLSSIPILSQALHENHSLYGLHFEGNSGFIDHRGFLNSTEREYSQYPLPIIKGIIRRIDGVKPNPINQFKGGNMRDVCWICHSWQQKNFEFPYTKQMKEEAKQCSAKVVECYIHLRHENYSAIKMFLSDQGDRFEVSRMCPIGNIQYFFTFYLGNDNRKVMINRQTQSLFQELPLSYYIGKIELNQTIKARNNSSCDYECDPLDETYQANIRLLPRSAQVGIGFKKSQKVKVLNKRKVVREEKVKVNLKDLDGEDDDFLKDKMDRDGDEVILFLFRQNTAHLGIWPNMQDYLRRCIDFDIENSKIPKVIKDKVLLEQFREMMVRHYRNFKDAFYFLSRGNPTVGGIYSISELEFMGFLQEQKYITKRVTQAKIMLKLYACLAAGDEQDLKSKKNEAIDKKSEQKSNNKLISRPQFMEFLVRLAIEKWCAFNPAKKKKEDLDKDKLFEDDLKDLKNKKQTKNPLKMEKSQKLQKQKVAKEQPKVEEKIEQAQVEGEEQQNEMKKFKLKLPLPLIDGIQRTMTSLSRYADNYRSSTWRKRKYLKIDTLIVLKAYEQFLSSLYEKYTESKFKTNKPKRISNMLTLEELKNLILDTDIRRTKEAMKEVEQAFIDSKRLEVQDGVMQYGLSFDEFQQCLARISEIVWFNPPCAPNAPIWDNQTNRKNTPLFIKFESLIVALYWRVPQLHNRRMGKIVLKGIFELEIEPIMQRIEKLSRMTGSFGFLRRNSMAGQQQISLREIIQELRQKFDKMVVHRQDVEEFYTEMDVHPQ